ncbi:MAG: HAMP domain-containing histidine kinase [Proteobacteria bacterium]|nr:MAG: HAMP domain-containing histidine kinase [Pseudomonadota bacterium]
MSLPIDSKDRAMSEALLEALISNGAAHSAAICQNGRQFLGTNATYGACGFETDGLYASYENSIPGSSSLTLVASFNRLKIFAPLLTILAMGLFLVFCAFIFIRTLRKNMEIAIFRPLNGKLFTDEVLEIAELNEIRVSFRNAQIIESRRAVAVAIEERNEQVAHDIRGPINALAELVKQINCDDVQLASALQKSISRVETVAEDLLEDRSKAGEIKSFYRIDLAVLIRDLIDEKTKIFNDVRFDFKLYGPEELTAQISLSTLARILSNLIDNSVIASSAHKEILIEADVSKDNCSIKIVDHGSGMSASTLEQIGRRGFSTRKNLTDARGNGLGVYSARNILSEIGGSVRYESTLGLGTTATIFLPCAAETTGATTDVEFVFIDNDELNRYVWSTRAQQAQINVVIFESVQEFIKSPQKFPLDTPLFIDSDLGDGVRGESFGPQLNALGYSRIIIATYSDTSKAQQLPFIERRVSKDFDLAVRLSKSPCA